MENDFNYTEQSLSVLSLMDLRKIGMKIGVKVPSMLRKSELIDEILAIYRGEKKPYVKMKSGRRTLTLKQEDEWADKIIEIFAEKEKVMKLYEFDFHIRKLKDMLHVEDNRSFLDRLSSVLEYF